MGRYKISVVTPYHNIDHNMFDGCVKSMLSQTIGFENIEWVITLHNCKTEYIDYAREKLCGYENVILDVLNNSCHTASSPRNNGLKLSTSDYVAFLDGDDKFRPDALERIVGYFEKTGAKVLVFRREYELEKPDMLAISETVPWDTTREMIMVDTRYGMDDRTYNDFPFFITSRAFDLNFLKANNICFDESIIVGEDIFFNLQTMHYAKSICFLPQFIGYVYYINSKSAIGGEKTDEEILRIATGLQTVIERTLDYGFFVDIIVIANAFVLSNYLSSPNIKMETRIRIKDIFEPYLKMTSPIPDGRFIEPFNSLMNTLPDEILMNPRRFEDSDCDKAMDGFEVLKGILAANKYSHYGKRYHFEDILTVRGYQSRLPVTDLSVYQPMIDVERSIGDTRVYVQDKPKWYIRLLNDMLVPVSAKQAVSYGDALKNVLKGNKVLVWSEDFNPMTKSNNGVYVSTVSGISIDEYREKYKFDLDEALREFSLPTELMLELESKNADSVRIHADNTYLKLLLCAADCDIDQIVLFGSFELGSLKSGLKEHLARIADDIEAGKILKEVGSHSAIVRKVSMLLRPDPERAKELRAVANRKEGFVLRDVWNNLTEITMISIHPTINDLTEYDGIKLRHSVIASEFGIIGTQADEDGVYLLNRNSIFYEFVNASGLESESPVMADALRPGSIVKPVITTDAGLYRLKLNIKIEIVGIEKGNIFFRLCR